MSSYSNQAMDVIRIPRIDEINIIGRSGVTVDDGRPATNNDETNLLRL
jgi:hypothetical protein